MTIMKKYYLLATALAALVSCSSDEFTGDPSSTPQGNSAIQFSSNAPKVTRTNSTDAAKLNYQFKVFGVKTLSSGDDQRVFATASSGVTPYDVWFVDNTASSTTSNSSNWEYVGTSGQKYGTIIGANDYQVELSADQTIKYWDYSASAYNFQAWSDLNTSENKVSISAIDKNTMTISGTPAKLANLYIADLVTISSPTSGTTPSVVPFTFRKAATKVRLGIYETVPGYDVKTVTFHYNDGEAKTSTANAYLTGQFIGDRTASASVKVTYSGTPQKAIIAPEGDTYNKTYFDFGSFDSSTKIGESASTPTWANPSTDNYINVFPNTSNVGEMTLTVDYTLSNTASGETIAVTGKTAKVPAAYMTWRPNYAYTYLFKITDDLLTPITLDAVVIEDGEGKQETITTVTEPSITTYANASNVTVDNEYKPGANIYVTVEKGSSVVTLSTTGTINAKLYTATLESGSIQEITEASVANVLVNGTPKYDTGVILANNTDLDGYYTESNGTYTPCEANAQADGSTIYYKRIAEYAVTDAHGKTMAINPADGLTSVTEIAASDTPDNNAISINGVKFTATTTYTAVPNGTTLTVGNRYYTSSEGAGEFIAETALSSDGTNYFVANPKIYVFEFIDTADGNKKYYKVIKVQ